DVGVEPLAAADVEHRERPAQAGGVGEDGVVQDAVAVRPFAVALHIGDGDGIARVVHNGGGTLVLWGKYKPGGTPPTHPSPAAGMLAIVVVIVVIVVIVIAVP